MLKVAEFAVCQSFQLFINRLSQLNHRSRHRQLPDIRPREVCYVRGNTHSFAAIQRLVLFVTSDRSVHFLIARSEHNSQLQDLSRCVRWHNSQLPILQRWIQCRQVRSILRFGVDVFCFSRSSCDCTVPHKGWSLAPRGASCSSHCAAEGNLCNSNVLLRVFASDDLQAVASSAGFQCKAQNQDIGLASPYVSGSSCFINQQDPSARSCSAAQPDAQRICCCGSNVECPVPIAKCTSMQDGRCTFCEDGYRLSDDKFRCRKS